MDIFGFFDYTPKSFLEKSPKEILNMKSNKVKEKFDEKYKDNEEYKQLSEDTLDAIFLLRVLKKGLKQEDKDRVLTICGMEDEPKVEEPSSLDNKPPSMQPRHSSIKKRTSIKQEQEEPAKEQEQMQEEPAQEQMQMQEQVEPAQFGGKRKKTRRGRNKRKACKKTKRHHRHSRKH